MTKSPDIGELKGRIDQFCIFRGSIILAGWCFADRREIAGLEMRPSGFPQWGMPRRFTPTWLPSPDVAAAYGPLAARCRFAGTVGVGAEAASMCGGSLVAIMQDGAIETVGKLGLFRESAASDLFGEFFAMIGAMPAPRVLEVGSRSRDGNTLRDRMTPAAEYTGCDILPGENVNTVCDAHALSKALPRRHYNAVLAVSVLEHLLMPWKFIIELNKVLAAGAVGLFTTHQCWPIHDAPWDYWRFSDRAWHGLLNKATGFEIIRAAMGEPAYVVAADCHPATNFAPEPAGFLASNVLFRKIGETRLTWNVDLADLDPGTYPV